MSTLGLGNGLDSGCVNLTIHGHEGTKHNINNEILMNRMLNAKY